MKNIKKILAFFITITMICANTSLPVFAQTEAGLVERTNSVDLRLGILNDTHITSGNMKSDYVSKALNTLKTLGADKLALIGDNVYYTKKQAMIRKQMLFVTIICII